MNYKTHCEKLLHNLTTLRKLVKDEKIIEAQDWLAEWWYEYEVAKCEAPPPGDYSMSSGDFEIFMSGFFDEKQRKATWDKIAEKRMVDENKRFHLERRWGTLPKPKESQGDLF